MPGLHDRRVDPRLALGSWVQQQPRGGGWPAVSEPGDQPRPTRWVSQPADDLGHRRIALIRQHLIQRQLLGPGVPRDRIPGRSGTQHPAVADHADQRLTCGRSIEVRQGIGKDAPLGITTIYLPITEEEKAEIARLEAQGEDMD